MIIAMSDIGSKIKKIREGDGLSQREFAKILKVKQSVISQYENNTRRPSFEVLVLIARHFEVSTDYLLGV